MQDHRNYDELKVVSGQGLAVPPAFKQSFRDFSFAFGQRIVPERIRHAGLLLHFRRKIIFWAREGFVLSYPKSGRTWLRTMIGRALVVHYGLNLDNPIEIQHFWKQHPGIPCIDFSHDDNPQFKYPDAVETDKSRYARKRILFLARDPRDVIVSYYFHARYRLKALEGSMGEFLKQGPGSIDSIIAFYNAWAVAHREVKEFQLITYEEMQRDPRATLKLAMKALRLPDISEATLNEVVSFGSLENMRKIEKTDAFRDERLRAPDESNPESFKVRRGKIGGYVDYLSTEEIGFLNARIEDSLDPYFSMYYEPTNRQIDIQAAGGSSASSGASHKLVDASERLRV